MKTQEIPMKTRTALTTLLALAATTIASFAHAGNPIQIINPNIPIYIQPDTSSSDFLKPFVQWLNLSNASGLHTVNFTLVSNQASGLASYATGSLALSGGKLTGTGSQLFSDRLYAWPSNGGGLNFATYPFNPFQADNLGVSIDPATGNVTLTLKSWGNKTVTFSTVADPGSGTIYGFGGSPRTMEVLSLQDRFM